MGDDLRRRTSFEKDLREFVLKIVLGVVFAAVLRWWTGAEQWLGPLAIGILLAFFLASGIRGSSHDAD